MRDVHGVEDVDEFSPSAIFDSHDTDDDSFLSKREVRRVFLMPWLPFPRIFLLPNRCLLFLACPFNR